MNNHYGGKPKSHKISLNHLSADRVLKNFKDIEEKRTQKVERSLKEFRGEIEAAAFTALQSAL